MDGPLNQNPQAPQSSGPIKKPINWFLISTISLVVVIIALASAVFYLWQKKLTIQTRQDPNYSVNPWPPPFPSYPEGGPPNFNGQVQDTNQPAPPEQYVSMESYEEATKIDLKEFPQLLDVTPNYQGEVYAVWYKVGRITQGPFVGKELYMMAEEGLGTNYRHYVIENDSVVNFEQKNIKIRGIDDIPETIALPSTNYILKKNWIAWEMYEGIKKQFKVFTHPTLGDFYLTDNGCFAVELPDHTAITYDFIIPFVNRETRELQVTFTSNLKNLDPYTYNRIVGCGVECLYLATMDESKLKPQERLVEAGKTSNGETLYEYKDANAPELKALYNDKNTVAYFNTEQGYEQLPKNKYTYEQFVSYHPLLYWKDPLGRWVEMKNDRFQIAAEMCKPVIYLYPSVPKELSVKVAPNGGFTYTKPLYNQGWRVIAYPDGTVKNLADGVIYPYLFWEGVGLNYPEQTSGFVVKDSDLESFLSGKLPILGLVGREAQDFKDYWVPRLVGLNKPYYKITFLKKEQMDELAPLDLSVEPTSVIRVMMTAKGLDALEKFPEQELPMPDKRTNFTLVEWGGAVLK